MMPQMLSRELEVTPFAGVWIEILVFRQCKLFFPSLPSRECGLKCIPSQALPPVYPVTPFAGVWIEIPSGFKTNDPSASLPSRECGLKWITDKTFQFSISSLPSRECGLKS